jgi:hypothetical protein
MGETELLGGYSQQGHLLSKGLSHSQWVRGGLGQRRHVSFKWPALDLWTSVCKPGTGKLMAVGTGGSE